MRQENTGLKMTANSSFESGFGPSCIHSMNKAHKYLKEVKKANTSEFWLQIILNRMTRLLTRRRERIVSLLEPILQVLSKQVAMMSNPMQVEATAGRLELNIIHLESGREYVKKIDPEQVFPF